MICTMPSQSILSRDGGHEVLCMPQRIYLLFNCYQTAFTSFPVPIFTQTTHPLFIFLPNFVSFHFRSPPSLSLSISPLGCVALRVSHHAARRGVEVHRAQQSPSEGSSLCEVQRGSGTRTSPRTAHSYIPSTHVLGRLEHSPLTRQAAVQCSAVQCSPRWLHPVLLALPML